MNGKRLESSSTKVKTIGDVKICRENDRAKQESFKLSYYPDKADTLDKEKMQKVWNNIESEFWYQEQVVTVQGKKEKSKCFKNDEKNGKEVIDLTNEEKRGLERGMDDRTRSPETSHIVNAIEILDRFKKLHMIEDCLEWTSGFVRQSDCLHCPPADCFEAKLDNMESQMKYYKEKIITQVIGRKRSQNISSAENEI